MGRAAFEGSAPRVLPGSALKDRNRIGSPRGRQLQKGSETEVVMVMTDARRKELVESYKTNAKDTGSPEVQVALLTERISAMTQHLKTHPKDNHSRRGLTKMVARRTHLLTYLRDKDAERYKTLIERLELRK